MKLSNEKLAIKVSIVTIIWNTVLSFFKLLAGIIGHSSAMISDSIHSFSDVFSTFIVIIGIKIAKQDSDKKHPYGHERFECVAAVILAWILLITGIIIGYNGIQNIINHRDNILIPTVLTIVAAVISIIVKEGMYWYTKRTAVLIDSSALLADAWHHRSDAFSSIGSLIGIIGTRLGLLVLDSIASIIICLFIIKVAIDIFINSINKLVDTSCNDIIINDIEIIIFSNQHVLEIDLLNTRLFGDKFYIDLEISIDKDLSFEKAHNIAHEIHDEIEKLIPKVKHCMIHINPKEKIIKSP